jgi:hypothetical protein
VIPLGEIEKRVVVVCLRGRCAGDLLAAGEVLALAELVEALNVVICHSFAGRSARTKADHGRQHT